MIVSCGKGVFSFRRKTKLPNWPFGIILEVAAAKMKFNPFGTSDRSKNHKRHFRTPSHILSKMSPPLSKEHALQERPNGTTKMCGHSPHQDG
jgi:hypothetical protein